MKISLLLASTLLLNHVNGYKQVHNPKEEKESTTEEQKPWFRTIYSTEKEIVTPTVIDGVTFSAKPPATSNGLEPWVSLEKDGRPKTIQPEIKNGHTKRGKPDYSTYFKTATIRTYSYEELEAYNMDPNEVHEEEILLDEDDTYTSLNPVIRCTPDSYFNKGLSKDILSEPFCTPRENVMWKVGTTYFVSWYTRFFENEHNGKVAENVRIHLSYVKEKASDKGYHKRDIPGTFFTSEWIKNIDGVYAIEPQKDWLQGQYERRIIVSVQPNYISDDEFSPLDNGVLLYMILGSKVSKTTKEEWALADAGISDSKWYYIALTMPAVAVVVFVILYFFLELNKGMRDFSDITNNSLNKKRRVLGKFANMKKFKNMKNHKYEELPTYNKNKGKQS